MRKAILLLGFILAFFTVGFAQPGDQNAGESRGRVILEKETEFSAALQNTIDAEKASVADDVRLKLTENVSGLGKGTEIFARVVRVEKITPDNDSSRVGLFLDFVKRGSDFLPVDAVVVSMDGGPDNVEFTQSETFKRGTLFLLKGKNLRLEEGTVIRFRLDEDLIEND